MVIRTTGSGGGRLRSPLALFKSDSRRDEQPNQPRRNLQTSSRGLREELGAMTSRLASSDLFAKDANEWCTDVSRLPAKGLYFTTSRVNGNTYAGKVTRIPTKAATAMLWKN